MFKNENIKRVSCGKNQQKQELTTSKEMWQGNV